MQAALCFAPPSLPINLRHAKALALPWRSMRSLQTTKCLPIKASADTSTVDYNSKASVFPAEACETIGGEACDAEMFPEVKLKPDGSNTMPRTASEQADREYFEYNSPKTVFPGEACDDLGGEFCEPEYQKGVY